MAIPSLRNDLLTRAELAQKFTNFANLSVIAVVLLLSTAVGIYFWWRGQKNSKDILLGGRNQSAFPVALSLSVNFLSGVTLVGVPAIIYTQGSTYAWFIFGQTFQMWITATFFMPMFCRLGLTSSYEYVEKRFRSKLLRTLCSLFFIIQTLLYMAAVVLVSSKVLFVVGNMDTIYSELIIFGVCILYTSLGGLKGVLWSDVLQFAVMVLSYTVIAIKGTVDVGSVGTVLDRNYHGASLSLPSNVTRDERSRLDPFEFGTDMRILHSVWSVLIGSTFFCLSGFGVNQMQVQRYVACKSEQVARRAIYMCIPGSIILFALPIYMGMVIYAFYYNCDPKSKLQVTDADHMLPLFVMQSMYNWKGLPGLFFTGIFSATLSTVSSGLNSLAAVFMQDFLRSFGVLHAISEKTRTQNGGWAWTTRLLAVAFGCVSFAMMFALEKVKSILVASLLSLSVLGGPVLGLFVLGMFVPFANATGALSGLLSAVIFALWFLIGTLVNRGTFGCSDKYPWSQFNQMSTIECPTTWTDTQSYDLQRCANAPSLSAFYDLSYIWIVPITSLWVVVVGVCVSMATTPQNPATLNREYLSPNATLLFRWWPSFVRAPLDNYFAQVGSEAPPLVKKDMDMDMDDETETAPESQMKHVSETTEVDETTSRSVPDIYAA